MLKSLLSFDQASQYIRAFHEVKKAQETPGMAYMLMVYRLQEWKAQGQISDDTYRQILDSYRLSKTTGVNYRKKR